MVETLVRFMGSYYSPKEIVDIGVGMAEDLARDDRRLTELQSTAFRHLIALPDLGNLVVDLLTQDSVIGAFGSSESPDIAEPVVFALIAKAKTLGGRAASGRGARLLGRGYPYCREHRWR